MSTVRMEIEDIALRDSLRQLMAGLRDLTPVMRQLSEIMVAASQRAFERRADPSTGAGWKPLSASRQRQREKKGRSAMNILQDSGLLVGSIARPGRHSIRRVGPFEAIVGTSVPYAAAHQFGAVIRREAAPMRVRLRTYKGKNLFAAKRHKRVRVVDTIRKAYTIHIPARPFLGVGEADLEKMRRTVTAFLSGVPSRT